MKTEEREFEPMYVLWQKFLPFWVTVLSGILLCTGYLISEARGASARSHGTGATAKGEEILPAAPEGWVVVNLPNPPAFVRGLASPNEQELDRKHSPLNLAIVAIQDAWLEVEIDGHRINGGLLRAEETVSFEASERIRIMTGNAPGLRLRLNGAPVAIAGIKRVRTLEFTSEAARESDSGYRSRSPEPTVQALAATTLAVASAREE